METGKPFTIQKKINLETGQTIKTIVMHSELRVSRTNTSRCVCVCVIFICCLFYSVCVWCFDMIFFRFTLCICRISLHTISFIFIINASFFNKQNRYILAKHYYWQLTHVAGQTKQNISYAANNFLSIKCMRLRTFWLVVHFIHILCTYIISKYSHNAPWVNLFYVILQWHWLIWPSHIGLRMPNIYVAYCLFGVYKFICVWRRRFYLISPQTRNWRHI